MNVILNPDRTRKNIVSVSEEEARAVNSGVDINQDDIFITDAQPIPDGIHTPQLSIDGTTWTEANQAAADAEQIKKDNARVKAELKEIDIDSVRSIREWLVSQPGAPQFIIDHEADAQAKRSELK